MKLDVLINHYKEPVETVDALLASIGQQTYKDFRVLIASDGDICKLPDSLINKYAFIDEYAVLEHQGLVYARNYLLDRATADYIMFIDADDVLNENHGFENIMNEASETGADMVSADFISEAIINGKTFYDTINENLIWLQGKIFKLQYIRDNKIRFPEDARIYTGGDMYFIWQAGNYSDNVKFIHKPFYLWKHNAESVTRKDKFFREIGYESTLLSYSMLTDLIIKKRPALIGKLVSSLFAMCFVDMNRIDKHRDTAPIEYQERQKAAVKQYIKKYGYYYLYADLITRSIAYYAIARSRKLNPTAEGFNMMQPWIKNILLEV